MFLYCIAFQYTTEMGGINIMFEYWAGRPCSQDVSPTLPLDTTLLAGTALSALYKVSSIFVFLGSSVPKFLVLCLCFKENTFNQIVPLKNVT